MVVFDLWLMRFCLWVEFFLVLFVVREESICSEEGSGVYILKYIKGILKLRLFWCE